MNPVRDAIQEICQGVRRGPFRIPAEFAAGAGAVRERHGDARSSQPRSICCSRARQLRSTSAPSTPDGMWTGRAASASATSSRPTGGSAARLNGARGALINHPRDRVGDAIGMNERNA